MEKIIWIAPEYEDKEHSQDWFWALGVIVITGALASIIFGNYFFAALLVIAGTMLGFFALKKPEMITYEINDRGIKMKNTLYPFDTLKAYWLRVGHEDAPVEKPALLIHTSRFFAPILSIPIERSMKDEIKNLMNAKNIKEEEMHEHLGEKIMEHIGF